MRARYNSVASINGYRVRSVFYQGLKPLVIPSHFGTVENERRRGEDGFVHSLVSKGTWGTQASCFHPLGP